jgi:outer membrane immunogenic protein
MLIKTLPTAALAALIAGPTLAGSLDPVAPAPIVEPAPAPVVYSGDWTGAYVGGQLGYGDVGGDIDANGEGAGLHAGYNWDFGGWVLGTELDHDFANIDLGGDDEIDGITRLKLRAGADMGRTLVYATAGAAHATATVGGQDLSDTGYFGGVGVDYQLNDRWVLGGEVLSHKFDDFDNSGVDVDATTASVRASFKF